MTNTEPKEQVVGETTDVVPENIVSSPLQESQSPVTTIEHPEPQEVSSEQTPIDTDTNPIDTITVSMPNRYELPPRSTRGVLQTDMIQSSRHKGQGIRILEEVRKVYLKQPWPLILHSIPIMFLRMLKRP